MRQSYFDHSCVFQVYAVCSSVKEQCTRIPRMTGEEKEFETIERGGTLFACMCTWNKVNVPDLMGSLLL